MLIHYIFLLLLSWQSVRGIEDETGPPDDVFDQVATASESHESFEQAGSSPEVLQESSTTAGPSSVATIHYENSNGFVPMTLGKEEEPGSSLVLEVTAESGERESTMVGIPSKSVEEDPVYLSEARMFLGLPGPSADRRSFDAQDIQGQFEILKVNDETPAIANYQEFYDNVQNKLNSNRDGQATYEDYGGRTESQNKRTKDRIKQIDKYLTNFDGRDRQPSAAQYDQYYDNYPGNARPRTKQKDIFEPEKVQFPEQPSSTGYDQSALNSRSQYSTPKNRYSKPVVVVEPSDYKIDMKFGSPQVTDQVTSLDNPRDQKHRKATPEVEQASRYDEDTRLNREDRYGPSRESDSTDYSGEHDYLEITEKPRRMHTKSRRRPQTTESSRRLPKEHRGNADPEVDDSRRSNSHNRSKPQRPRTKPIYWADDDRDSEETSDERPSAATPTPDVKKPKQSTNLKTATSWNQVGPNIEVSHSNGFEIGQIDKPKQLLVPVNLNLLPLGTFDHSAAIGNSQGFDFTNVPNFITATPMVSTQAPLLSTGHSLVSSGHGSAPNQPKTGHHTISNNYGQPAVPDVIVGQNTYQNSVQAVLLPHMNINGKFATNLRSHYSASTAAPMFTVTHTLNPNLQNVGPTMAGVPNYQSTPRPGNAINQNVHQMTVNPSATSAVPQLLIPQPTLQTLPLFHAPYNTNILVNPNGLHGQNAVQPGNPSGPSGTGLNSPSSTTTPQPLQSANNYHETQPRRNNAGNSNAQFVTTASLAVANVAQQGQPNIGNDHKYYVSASNPANSNSHFYSLNQNGEHASRPQQHENFYQIYRDDQNPNGKIKTYVQTAQVVPAIIHQANGIPVNIHHQNYANVGQLQEQQSILSPSVVLQRPRDQNQQILNAANDIFENTWKQLQQLRSNEDTAARRPYQHVYGMSDNFGATSNANGNTFNGLPITNVNSAKAHLPILSTQNVEIVNPNIKPSPVDLTIVNPYDTLNHYQGAILTTPVPIFGTTTNFLAGRPIVASSTPAPMINLQNYMDQLTQIGAQSNRANRLEPRPTSANQDPQRQLFNPINFVPNSDLMKSQSMLNSKNTEPLPDQLSLVPLVPGGNFFKNSQGAQTELMQKPRLSSDLEKYADEMFRESLKTIYSTHKWNNDVRARANYSSPETSDLAKLRTELQRFKASMPDPKYSGKDVLEAHHSETSVRTAESSSRPTKKPELSMSDIEELFKSDFKLNLASEGSHHGTHQKHRPGHHGSSRPSSNDHSTEFRNYKQLSNYLTPPKFNSFLSKIPFTESPKSGKKRPGSSVRYNSPNGRPLSRPSSLVSRPASSLDASASDHLETGLNLDSHHRYEKHRPYPTFTTTSSPDTDPFKASSSELFSKNDYYDINHPRMHNLLGLLMKNKQLPRGSSQSYMRNMDDHRQYFDDERRRVHSELDPSINMGPPAPPYLTNYRPYPNPGSA